MEPSAAASALFAGAEIGERVLCDGQEGDADPKLSEKKGKAPFPVIAEGLKTIAGEGGVAVAAYNGRKFACKSGPVTCGKLVDCIIK